DHVHVERKDLKRLDNPRIARREATEGRLVSQDIHALDLRRGTDIEGPHLDLDEFRQRHRDVLRVDARTAIDRRRIFPREHGRLHPFANWVTTTMKVPVRLIRAGARTTGDSSTRRAPHPRYARCRPRLRPRRASALRRATRHRGRERTARPVSSHREGRAAGPRTRGTRSEEHTSELQSPCNLVCRLLLEKKKKKKKK